MWDKIILRGENTKLSLKDMKSKYFFFDDGNGLRFDSKFKKEKLFFFFKHLLKVTCSVSFRANKNITLTLSWNVVPNAGILPLVAGSGQVSLPFPESYETAVSY